MEQRRHIAGKVLTETEQLGTTIISQKFSFDDVVQFGINDPRQKPPVC